MLLGQEIQHEQVKHEGVCPYRSCPVQGVSLTSTPAPLVGITNQQRRFHPEAWTSSPGCSMTGSELAWELNLFAIPGCILITRQAIKLEDEND